MPKETIPFKDTRYFSDFICDYLAEKENLKPFYNRFPKIENFKAQIKDKQNSYASSHRLVLEAVLNQQYVNTSASKLTRQHINSLTQENTFTITTGHQLNLFTGPVYYFYKIISVIKLCQDLKGSYANYNFVPVFWMATEDHDFDEINYFNFKGKKIQWNSSQTGPVGRFNTQGLDDVVEVMEAEFGQHNLAQDLIATFKKAYLEHDTLAEATRFLANHWFGEHGLVVIDADDARLKRLFLPQIKQELLDDAFFKAVEQTSLDLSALNYKNQVTPREINLFYITDDLRERIVKTETGFAVLETDIKWSTDELLEHLEEHPERFSPNVITRPLFQECILPNLCYVGGGGELAYWLQLKTAFKEQHVVFPMLLLRNSVMVQSQKQASKTEKLRLHSVDLFLDKHTLINKHVRKISNIDINFSKQIYHLKQQFRALYQLAEQTDKTFNGAVKAQEVKQIKGLQKLEKRLLKAQKRKLKDEVERLTILQEALFPGGNLQERTINFSELYLTYGTEIVSILMQELNPLEGEFLLLTLD